MLPEKLMFDTMNQGRTVRPWQKESKTLYIAVVQLVAFRGRKITKGHMSSTTIDGTRRYLHKLSFFCARQEQ
jgi:hypothetical protein